MRFKIPLVFIFLLVVAALNAQLKNDSLYLIWENEKQSPVNRANAYNKLIHTNYVDNKPDSAYVMAKELVAFNKENNLRLQYADALITLANSKRNLGDLPSSLTYYMESLEIYEELEDKSGMAVAYTNIGSLYKKEFKFDRAIQYHEESLRLSEEMKDTAKICQVLINIGNVYNSKYDLTRAVEYYDRGLKLSSATNDKISQIYFYTSLADNYSRQKKYDKAVNYYQLSLNLSDEMNNLNTKLQTLFHLSISYLHQENYNQVIKYSELCLDLIQKKGDNRFTHIVHRNMYEAYKGKNDLQNAFKHLEESNNIERELEEFDLSQQLQQLEIEKIRMQDSLLQVEKEIKTALVHEKEIQQKNTEKMNIRLAWGGSLSAVSIFAFLIFRKTKRKQRKAEKERREQILEKEKILKDLELSTIDAMLQGQEKERQRLAADLHDSVGATLSAAKLQFQYLIKNQNNEKYSEELIKKTSTLLEDAYVEIRSMAHLKNSGVMAKNGLLPAVEKLSKNASGINGLTFEVQSFGLEKRLENSLEISIFRIIQELVTNVIKHANATKGYVHLTNHDDNINIMIEDNGKGFNPSQITKSREGMGISNIDKRVEHLEGKLTIESEINKGTTVIIDIPL